MSMTEKIRIAMVKRGNISGAELARRLGVSSQNLSNKMKRDNFSEQELVEIADALDCDVKITLTFRDTGEEL
jgi:DNA-binding Xre family transcriptional regulator